MRYLCQYGDFPRNIGARNLECQDGYLSNQRELGLDIAGSLRGDVCLTIRYSMMFSYFKYLVRVARGGKKKTSVGFSFSLAD